MQHGFKAAFAPLHRVVAGPRRAHRRFAIPMVPAVRSDPDGLARALALAVPVSAILWVVTGIAVASLI